MDLRQIEYVVGVAEHGTFTAAAEALFVTQPSLSQSIGRLERELGVQLFHRVGRGVSLSAAGHAFLMPARQILRDLQVVHDAVSAVRGNDAGTLDLVSLPTLAADPLAPLVGEFRRTYPRVAIRVREPESADAVIEHVRDGRAEVGLAEIKEPIAGLAIDPLIDQELVAILPPGDTRRCLRIAALDQEPLVASMQGTSTRRLVEEAFGNVGVAPHLAVETQQRDAIVPLVLAGAGIAFVPPSVARVAAHEGAAVATLIPAIRRSIGLITRNTELSPAARAFRDIAWHSHANDRCARAVGFHSPDDSSRDARPIQAERTLP